MKLDTSCSRHWRTQSQAGKHGAHSTCSQRPRSHVVARSAFRVCDPASSYSHAADPPRLVPIHGETQHIAAASSASPPLLQPAATSQRRPPFAL